MMANNTWYAPGTGTRAGKSRTRIAKSAVPLGQHSHHPDQVMPLPERVASATTAALAAPSRRCARCPEHAALVEPVTGRAYCAAHWITCVVQNQLD